MITTSAAEGCTVPLRLQCYSCVDDVQLLPSLLDQGPFLHADQVCRSTAAEITLPHPLPQGTGVKPGKKKKPGKFSQPLL